MNELSGYLPGGFSSTKRTEKKRKSNYEAPLRGKRGEGTKMALSQRKVTTADDGEKCGDEGYFLPSFLEKLGKD